MCKSQLNPGSSESNVWGFSTPHVIFPGVDRGSAESIVTEAQLGDNRVTGQPTMTSTCFIIFIIRALHLSLDIFLRLLGKTLLNYQQPQVKHKPVALSTRTNPTKMRPKLERICVYVQCSQMASCKAHSAQNVLILTDTKPSLSNDLQGTKATTHTISSALVM